MDWNFKMTDKPLYVTWSNDDEKQSILSKASSQLSESKPIVRSLAFDTFKNIRTNVSIRNDFGRDHYEYFRENETIPKGDRQIIAACMGVAERVGIIQNIINLMADFTCQGIRLRHESPRIQKFYEEWGNKVGFAERSERIANMLFRSAHAPILKATAKLKPSQVKKFYKGLASGDLEVEIENDFDNREIPWRYTILDPTTIEVSGSELALFSNKLQYSVIVDQKVRDRVLKPKTEVDKELAEEIPQYIKDLFKKGMREIPLPDDRFTMLYFKKDDSQLWARPITYSILSDIILLEKMKLADSAALDGAISHIRIWKLGSLDHKIWPTKEALEHLNNILLSNVGGGVMDLLWGPDLELLNTSTEVQKFLDSSKYDGVLGRIYSGMGIPETLSGKATAGGFTNNFISMKTLIERLNYARMILTSFWMKELKQIQKAMGFSSPPYVVYDRMSLSDEAAEMALILQLIDRDIISMETAQELFDQIPQLEQSRINREHKARKNDKLPQKAGPWHNPQQEYKYIETLLQQGMVTPSQIGIELEPADPNEERYIDLQMKKKQDSEKLSGIPGQGRPKNKRDSQKRKQKRVVPRSNAFMTLLAWATEAQKELAVKLNEGYLKLVNCKNLRSLTNAQVSELEDFKFAVFLKLKPYGAVNDVTIGEIMSTLIGIPGDAETIKSSLLEQLKQNSEKQITIDDRRSIQAVVYAYLNIDEGESDEDI